MSEGGQHGAILLYRPSVHLWWIITHWSKRPFALIVCNVIFQSLMALFSPNCIGTLVTQVAVLNEQSGTIGYYSSRGRRSVVSTNMPAGFYESCIWLKPVTQKSRDALAKDLHQLQGTRAGRTQHMKQTMLWLFTGLFRQSWKAGREVGIPTSDIFTDGKLWTSGSLVATSLFLSGYDVTRSCGTAYKHFRNCNFLQLERTNDFIICMDGRSAQT